MSDAANNAAPTAPVSTEAPAQTTPTAPVATETPQATAPKPEGPKNQNAAKRAAMDRLTSRVAQQPAAPVAATPAESTQETAVNAAGRKIDPVTKQFVPESAAAPVAAAPQEAKLERTEVPEGFVRIALPEGHPWRRGDKAFVDVPAALEQDARTVVNQPVRRNELEAAQREAAQLRARLEVMQSGVPADPVKDPLLAQLIADVAESYDKVRPGTSDLLKQALTKLPEAEVRARVDEYTAQEADRERGRTFLADVNTTAPTKFSVWAQAGELNARLQSALNNYGAQLDQENDRRAQSGQPFVYPDPAEFFRRLDVEYAYDPRVQQKIAAWRQQEAQKEREKIEQKVRAELAEAEKKKLGEMADRHRNVRGPSRLVASGRPDGRAITPPTEDLSKLSPSQRQKLARERAIARAGL